MSNQEPNLQLEIDNRVKQLIIEALQYSADNPKRRQIIEGLLALIDNLSGCLTEDKLDENLRPYYDDARRVSEADIIKNLKRFTQNYNFNIENTEAVDVRVCFVRWYNKILKCDCIDKWRQWKKIPPPISLDKNIGEDGSSTLADIVADTQNLPPMEKAEFDENKRQQELLFNYIQEDPDNKLRNCKSTKYPQLNCWELSQRRLLTEPPETFEAIANALGVNLQTIASHWKRNCLPLLLEIVKKFGFDGV